jgi:hypothetical protein
MSHITLCILCSTSELAHNITILIKKCRCKICMLCHPKPFYLLKLARLSLWYSLDCHVWVWVCRGQSQVIVGNKLNDQDRDTPKRKQLSQYKWLCLSSWVKYEVWMAFHILFAWRPQIWVIIRLLSHSPFLSPSLKHIVLLYLHDNGVAAFPVQRQ